MELVKNEFINTKVNTKTLKVIVLLMLLVLLYGVNNTYVYYTSLIPFGVSVVFALLFIGFNGFVLGALYLVSILATSLNIVSSVQGVCVGGVLCLLQWLIVSKGLILKKWKLFLFYMLSLFTYVISSLSSHVAWLAVVVSVLLGLIFLYSCMVFLDATIGKGLLNKINLDEKICGCVILIIFSIGICNGNILIINLGFVFCVIIILLMTRLTGASNTIVCGALIGIGFAIYYLQATYVSLMVIMSLMSYGFKCRCKYLSATAIFLTYAGFTLFFDFGFSIGELLSVLLGCIVYLCLPNKLIDKFSNIFIKSKTVLVNNIFNNGKVVLQERIKNLSVVFSEMDKVYRDMVRGNLKEEDAKTMLKDELVAGVCVGCENRDRCFRESVSFMEQCIEGIVSVGFDKGKLMLIDLPEYLTTNCYKVNSLVQYFNNLISAYSDYSKAISNVDTSRLLIAEQLGGVSRLLECLSKEVDINVNVGNVLEEDLKERLGYVGVLCLECGIYEKNSHTTIINLIVKNSKDIDKKIVKVVNKCLHGKYKITSIKPSMIVGALDIMLMNRPNYDIVFGCCSVSKSGKVVSGDSHVVTSVSESQFIVSICDGMGSGGGANKVSKLTLSLIENFYRAGFDHNTILSSINTLLSLNEDERFSTIDLCIIDTLKNTYDFIKLGACNGYIRRASGEVEKITSSGLPIGVIENIMPHITKSHVCNMDMLIFVSDGVDDVLGESLQYHIATSNLINPQTLAENILQKALDDCGGVSKDDMTIVCVRVFESV